VSEVEHVALWAGLIANVVSIVLSLVAIWFAVHVNTRSENVSDQTIRSLQKIESFVQRLSEDTAGLIKGAWDKMLGGLPRTENAAARSSNAREIASGLTTELKSEIEEEAGPRQGVSAEEVAQRLENTIDSWGKALAAQIAGSRARAGGQSIFSLYRVLRRLSPEAREVLFQMRDHHLTRAQYKSLLQSALRPSMAELRNAGLIVPLTGVDDSGKKVAVYWYPPESSETLRRAIAAFSRSSPEVRRQVEHELVGAGYTPSAGAPGA
jgi:hypothetical protein